MKRRRNRKSKKRIVRKRQRPLGSGVTRHSKGSPHRKGPRAISKKFCVGIVAKPRQAVSIRLVERVIQWLEARSIDYRVDREFASSAGWLKRRPPRVIDREQFTSLCDPIIVLGGDGTLISVCRHPSAQSPQIIGVNLGTLGFLTEITVDELFPTLERVLAGRAVVEKRCLLHARVKQKKRGNTDLFAINDVVITKGALARIFALDFSVDQSLAATLRGDGVIVSTPSGSTAYSLSAGGSIVHPQVDAILVTPICPHSLTSRPLVIPGNSQVNLRVATASKEDGAVFFTVDGQLGIELSTGDEVSINTSDKTVSFVKSPSRNYFQLLGTKLKWANG